jgi:hypothetical protein
VDGDKKIRSEIEGFSIFDTPHDAPEAVWGSISSASWHTKKRLKVKVSARQHRSRISTAGSRKTRLVFLNNIEKILPGYCPGYCPELMLLFVTQYVQQM